MGRLRGWCGGYILLDALAALAIVLVGMAILLSSLSAIGRIALRQSARTRALIEARNTDARDRAGILRAK
jgi:uncharacterized membrane protein